MLKSNCMKNIRNFSIIAHIDHGKSTLSDRMIEKTHTVSHREMKEQLLDTMDLERERGITIKLQAVRMQYKAKDGHSYQLNLIDTPGHVDFTYEVSRSLAACEGALLLIDATQGIEAQSVANFYLALENDLEIIPVINKTDLPSAEPENVAQEVEQVFGIPADECLFSSAKTGEGIEDILEAVVARVPPPESSNEKELKALIFDANYDVYRGVVSYIRVFSGEIKKGEKIQFMATGRKADALEVGFFKPQMTPAASIKEGEVGYLIANIKDVGDTRVGDTITLVNAPAAKPLTNYKEAKPMVFCGFYPVDTDRFNDLKEALVKLKLNDSALHFMTETSEALGFGFRCGFLGLLHLEIIQERIEREFNIELIATAPNVTYRITRTDGEVMMVENPNRFPESTKIETVEEPFMGLSIITPNTYIGAVMELASEHRAVYKKAEFIDALRQMITFSIPLNELIANFFDKLKSRTRGYASMDYWFEEYTLSKLSKVDILINNEPVDALSFIAHEGKARNIAKKMIEKLRKQIPRQLFAIVLQGAIGSNIICRETISPLKKNVTAKCYGGDITRKRKLLEKQKAGKKKMKSIGSVEVPKDAFMAILKIRD
ncbi:translation elongation factor 4 [Candidatus Margulisiibacteriota bacterium]